VHALPTWVQTASRKTCNGTCFAFWQVSFGGLDVDEVGWVALL